MDAGASALNATHYGTITINLNTNVWPVAGISIATTSHEVKPWVTARSVTEFIYYAKANPGKINMASSGIDGPARREMLDGVGQLNALAEQSFGDPEIATRIAQYEMAYRMQTSVPELTSLSGQPKAVLDMYGPDAQTPGTFAHK